MAKQVPEQVYNKQQDSVYDVQIMPQQQPKKKPEKKQTQPKQQQMEYYQQQQPNGQQQMNPQQDQGQQSHTIVEPVSGNSQNLPQNRAELPTDANNKRNPIWIRCPYCNTVSVTRIAYRATGATVCCSVLLFLTFWPFMCLPYSMKCCNEAVSYCVICTHIVGKSPAFG